MLKGVGGVSEQLKPCPFCGSSRVLIVDKKNADPFINQTKGSLLCDGGCAHVYIRNAFPIEGIVEQWNKRPIEDKLRAQVLEHELGWAKLVHSESNLREWNFAFYEEVSRLKSGLEFYAAKENYQKVSNDSPWFLYGDDCGKIARECLKESGE